MNHLEMAKNGIEILWAKGVDFTIKEVIDARKNNKLLLLDMDFTSNCDLHCYYCDRTPDRFLKEENKKQLTTEMRKNLILQAKKLGARTIEFPGSGEPMLDEGFWEIIEFIDKNEMTPVVFTSGYHLNQSTVDKLYKHNVTLFLKYNSRNPQIQDKIVGVEGYGDHVNNVLEMLIEKGFNKQVPTRLAIDMVISPKNNDMSEIEDIFRWCRKNNVHSYISTLIPEGLADKKSKLFERNKALDFINRLHEIDNKEFGLNYESILPMAGGYRCRQVNIGLFVNLYGEVYDCNGLGNFLGNVYSNQLEEIWNSPYSKNIRNDFQNGYCYVRERVWDEIGLKGFDRKLAKYKEWEEKNHPDEILLNGLNQR